jgi:hypothetical protein
MALHMPLQNTSTGYGGFDFRSYLTKSVADFSKGLIAWLQR